MFPFCSIPFIKGRIAIVTDVGVECGGRGGVEDDRLALRTEEAVWFWRAQARR